MEQPSQTPQLNTPNDGRYYVLVQSAMPHKEWAEHSAWTWCSSAVETAERLRSLGAHTEVKIMCNGKEVVVTHQPPMNIPQATPSLPPQYQVQYQTQTGWTVWATTDKLADAEYCCEGVKDGTVCRIVKLEATVLATYPAQP